MLQGHASYRIMNLPFNGFLVCADRRSEPDWKHDKFSETDVPENGSKDMDKVDDRGDKSD